jgi:hypothetical protein
MRSIICIPFIIEMCFAQLYSQDKPISERDWLTIGGGIGKRMRLSSFVSYTFAGESIYQLSINDNREFSFMGGAGKNYFISLSIAYGKKNNWSFGFGSVFAGPSFVLGKEAGENNKYTVGLNIGSQFLFTPLAELGLGLDAFCNLNFYESFYGLRLAIFFKIIR